MRTFRAHPWLLSSSVQVLNILFTRAACEMLSYRTKFQSLNTFFSVILSRYVQPVGADVLNLIRPIAHTLAVTRDINRGTTLASAFVTTVRENG